MNPLQWLAWSLAWPYYLAASTWAGLLEALVGMVACRVYERAPKGYA